MSTQLSQVMQLTQFKPQRVLNDFYQGLKLLIEYETDQCRGSMSNEFFAINKIIGHFDSAIEQGDLIAPFFLHYVAENYPGYIDAMLLPDLSTIPSHKSRALEWVDTYHKFRELRLQIQKLTTPRVILVDTERKAQGSKKRQAKKTELIFKLIVSLQNKNAIGCLLAANLFKQLKSGFNASLLKLIGNAYEMAAGYPDPLGLLMFYNFLLDTKQFDIQNLSHQKVLTELQILDQNDKQLKAIFQDYLAPNQLPISAAQRNRFVSQWKFLSAIHGDLYSAADLMFQYIINEVQWRYPIDRHEQFDEAIKLYNWFVNHATPEQIKNLGREIGLICSDYQNFIGDDKFKASFLSYLLNCLNDYLHKKYQTLSLEDFSSQYSFMHLVNCNCREICWLTWQLNGNKLPSILAPLHMVWTEIGLKLQDLGKTDEPVFCFRKAYKLNPENAVNQYNLAISLETKKINLEEQVELYNQASKQGCSDSMLGLFRACVIHGHGTIEHLKRLEALLIKADENLEGKALLLFILKTTIYERESHEKLVSWIVNDIKGEQRYEIHFHAAKDSPEAASEKGVLPNHSNLDIEPYPENITKQSTSARDAEKGPPSSANTASLTSQVDNSFVDSQVGFFKQKDNKECQEFKLPLNSSAQKRALKTLEALNLKGIRKLTVGDFIKAQRAYEIIAGNEGGLRISHKGRSSGSRIKIGGKNMHLPHGRDRLVIGAQRSIRDEINVMYAQAQKL